jgi:hypothetical protein
MSTDELTTTKGSGVLRSNSIMGLDPKDRLCELETFKDEERNKNITIENNNH